MNDWVVTLVVLAILAYLIVIAVRRKWVTKPRGSFTGMTVYHDWVNQDAQRGTEVIIERNAGKQEFEEESGAPDDDKTPNSSEQRDNPGADSVGPHGG